MSPEPFPNVERRVVVTGMGVVSALGNSIDEVRESLCRSRSGIRLMPDMTDAGFPCKVFGPVKRTQHDRLRKQPRKTMTDVSLYAVEASMQALEAAGWSVEEVQGRRVAVAVGTAFSGLSAAMPAETWLIDRRKPSRSGATPIAKQMKTSPAANVSVYFGLRGRSHGICSSFAAGADAIGYGYELIKFGLEDCCLCGGAEEAVLAASGNLIRKFWRPCPGAGR